MPSPLDPSKIPEIQQAASDQSIADAEKRDFLFTLECDAVEEALEGQKQDRIERKKYAAQIFRVLVWLWIGIFVLITMQGFSAARTEKFFELPINLLYVLSGGASVFSSVFTVVIKYLFSSSQKPAPKAKPTESSKKARVEKKPPKN